MKSLCNISILGVVLRCAALLTLVGVGIASRFIDHAPNLTPIVGLSLLAGYYFRTRWALLVPLGIMAVSNCWLGHYDWPLMIAVYGCFALPAILGRWAGSTLRAGGLALVCACSFFICTNFVVWIGSGFYPQTVEGLLTCYIAALPFFRNTLLGDLGSTIFLFGLMDLVILCQRNPLPIWIGSESKLLSSGRMDMQ